MAAHFESDRVALVDKLVNTTLVRGPRPLSGDTEPYSFAYSELAEKLTELQVSLDKSFLIDVCLIDCVGERWQFIPEVTAFGVSEDKWPSTYWPPYLQTGWDPTILYGKTVKQGKDTYPGSLVWWPIEGLTPQDDKNVFLKAPGWDFSGLVDYVIKIAEGQTIPTVLYFHCSCGADRTGALHRSYLMRHQGMNYDDACLIADHSTPAGAPNAGLSLLSQDYYDMIKGTPQR